MSEAMAGSAARSDTRVRPGLVVTQAYLPPLLSMMTVGIIVPFIGTLTRTFGASPAELGLAIALYSIPTAIFALGGGWLVDRFGVRRSLLVALLIAATASLVASTCQSLRAFDAAVLLAGIGYAGICVASPCLVMQTLGGEQRTRAMSFVSTYPPTGYAFGLLLGAALVDSGRWQLAFQLHAALLVLCCLLFATGPAGAAVAPAVATGGTGASPPLEGPLSRLAGALRDPRILRLGIAVALPNALSYGTSLAAPAHLARTYNVSLAMSASAVAAAKIIALIIGSITMGYLLSRSKRTTALFGIMAAIGLLAQVLIFLPIAGIVVSTAALILWIFAFGGMAGGAMALLPTVVRDPSRSGAATGLVNQLISSASFAAPPTWLALHEGPHFLALAAACIVVSFIALPKGIEHR